MALQIRINSEDCQLGQDLPDKITHLNIVHTSHPFHREVLQPGQAILIKRWLNEVMDRLELEDGYVTYNGLAVRQEDLNKFLL